MAVEGGKARLQVAQWHYCQQDERPQQALEAAVAQGCIIRHSAQSQAEHRLLETAQQEQSHTAQEVALVAHSGSGQHWRATTPLRSQETQAQAALVATA